MNPFPSTRMAPLPEGNTLFMLAVSLRIVFVSKGETPKKQPTGVGDIGLKFPVFKKSGELVIVPAEATN